MRVAGALVICAFVLGSASPVARAFTQIEGQLNEVTQAVNVVTVSLQMETGEVQTEVINNGSAKVLSFGVGSSNF